MQSQETRVCFLTSRLMKNQIKSQKRATSKKEEKATTRMLWLLRKAYRSWVVYYRTQMHSILKERKSFGETRCKESWNTNQRVRFTKSTLRHASIRDKKGPSFRKIQVKPRHQRSPHAMKFEDRSREETERQQRCARSTAWVLAKNRYKLKEKDKAAFNFPAEEWVLPAASTKEPEERKFVVDSGASTHMVCKKDSLPLLSWRP